MCMTGENKRVRNSVGNITLSSLEIECNIVWKQQPRDMSYNTEQRPLTLLCSSVTCRIILPALWSLTRDNLALLSSSREMCLWEDRGRRPRG